MATMVQDAPSTTIHNLCGAAAGNVALKQLIVATTSHSSLHEAVLCCAVLAVLCCVVLCCAVLCCQAYDASVFSQ